MQLADLSAVQVMSRSGTLWVGALIVHAAATLFAARRTPNGRIAFLLTLGFGISYALALLAGSVIASAATSLALAGVSHNLHEEVFAAICFVGGLGGMVAGAYSAAVSRAIGNRMAGVPTDLPQLKAIWTIERSPGAASHSAADERYRVANRVAWAIFVILIGTCLWREAPNWLLLLVSSLVAVATLVAMTFRPGQLSLAAIRSDANAGLLTLTTFAPLGLALRAIYRFELIDWRLPLLVAVLVGLPATVLQLRPLHNPKMGRVRTALFALFFCYTGSGSLVWSSLLFANDIVRPEPFALYPIRIAAKHEERGKYDIRYWLNAEDPPDLNGIENFHLNKLRYDSLNVGGKACIEVWRGTLLLRWYEVTNCEVSNPNRRN